MKFKHILIFTYVMLIGKSVLGQNNIVHVNQSTGAANINIPLFTLNAARVSLPIGLVYNATGIRVNDVEGTAGMGWDLNAGGAITRQLRGLPDDVGRDALGNYLTGWMQNGIASRISGFNIANTGASSTCSDEAADVSYIKANFYSSSGMALDTEPDIFSVNAPGLSCQLVFDDVHQNFYTIPYLDVKINYTIDSTNGITAFTITNDEGITYTFAQPEKSYQKATGTGATAYFNTTHSQYANGINYNSAWNLTSIADIYNNSITIAYTPGTIKGYNAPVQIYGATQPATTLYNLIGSTTPNLITTISYSDGVNTTKAFDFTYASNTATQKSFISSIVGLGRNFQFTYLPTSTGTHHFTRNFLDHVNDGDCGTPFYYSFDYISPSILPDSTSTALDLYGYYNGAASNISLVPTIYINPSTAGYDRYSNTDYSGPYSISIVANNRPPADLDMLVGTLNTIHYVDGGSTMLSFEPNKYYDNAAGTDNNYGSGLRITQIQDNDGSKTITKNYTYTDPVTGHSSGQPVSLPIFAFTTGYTGNLNNNCSSCQTGTGAMEWNYSTIRSAIDISSEEHTVYYSTVTESQAGLGYTVYNFINPATYNAAPISTPLPWSQTYSYIGRTNTTSPCVALGHLVYDKNTYPFAPNINYDFERGLVSSITNYNDAGKMVTQVNYTYSTPSGVNTITAVKDDINGTGATAAYNYTKYNIYTNTGPLTTQVQKQVFDLTALTAVPLTTGQTTTTNYAYNSTYHRKPTKISIVNSNGNTETTNMTYVKDYIIPYSNGYHDYHANDAFAIGIQNLQNLNYNGPVEKYYQVALAGIPTPITTGGELIKYSAFTTQLGSLNLPVQKLKFIAATGTSSFQPSTINSSGNFINDANYKVSENDLAYDYSGNLLSSDDGAKNITTSLIDHNTYQPAIIAQGTLYNEIAATDFDSQLLCNKFSVTGTTSSNVTGRSGPGSLTFGPGAQLTSTVQKNTFASNYVLSMWIKSGASGQINVSLTGSGSATATIPYQNTTSPNTSTGWKFYRITIPITAITGSSIAVSLSQDPSSTQTVTVDDILFYPDVAQIKTFAYDPITHYKTAETDMNGVGLYYNNDQFGRLTYIMDQDKNITVKNTYVSNYNNQIEASATQSFTYTVSGNVYTFTNTSFLSPCSVSPTVRWQFPTGNFVTSYGNAPVSYTYTGTQSFQVCMWLDYDASNPAGGVCQTITPQH